MPIQLDTANIATALHEYFRGNNSKLAISASDVPTSERMEWLGPMFERPKPHDEDYVVFDKLNRLGGAILDIGANYGYSIASLLSVGCSLPMISFEPLQQYGPFLEMIKRKLGERFEYHLLGLSDREGVLWFHTPVLNGVALTALTSSDPSPYTRGIAENIVQYAKTYMPESQNHDLRVCSIEAKVARLDELVARGGSLVAREKIAAMKIDTEGTEELVLRGAALTIARDRPLLLIETANDDARKLLQGLGYMPCNRVGTALLFSERGSTRGFNHFFAHSDHRRSYHEIGLMRTFLS